MQLKRYAKSRKEAPNAAKKRFLLWSDHILQNPFCRKDAQYQDWSMTKISPLWHICAKIRKAGPKSPKILKANHLYCWCRNHNIKSRSEQETKEFLRSKLRYAGRFGNGIRFNESRLAYEWVMFHIYMSRDTHMKELPETSHGRQCCAMSEISMSHILYVNESCLTHINGSCLTYRWMSHVSHIDEWVMSQI